MIRRRDFITILGGAAAGWPLGARAQQRAVPVIGFLGANSATLQREWTAAFVQKLGELGWLEGRNLKIEYRWAEARFERSPEFIAEFVRLAVDVIVTHGTANVAAAKEGTSVIPIVFAAVPAPVGDHLVASLARPGGNITGLSNQSPEVAGKRLELLREVVPGLRRLAILSNVDPLPMELHEVQAAARTLGLEFATWEVRRAADFAPAFEALKSSAEALYVVADPLMTTNRVRVNTLAAGARLATISVLREYVDAGLLMSYGPSLLDQFRRSAAVVDKILRGTKPGDIPVEQPTKFELVVNLTTAKAIGLTIPESFLARADEVIE